MDIFEQAWAWASQYWPYLIGGATVLVGGWRAMAYTQSVILQHKLRRCDEVTKSYIDYQQLCLSYPNLATSCFGRPAPHLTEAESIQRDLMFDIVTSIFERAFVAVREEGPPDVRNSQWPRWKTFIEGFTTRLDYREWWRENVFDFDRKDWSNDQPQYDREFEKYMHSRLVN
jgi:hypothetical protein